MAEGWESSFILILQGRILGIEWVNWPFPIRAISCLVLTAYDFDNHQGEAHMLKRLIHSLVLELNRMTP
jgi:hypothetical protein